MENVVLMKNSTIKGGIFTKSLRKIMAEKMEKAKGLWYKAGATYSAMPTFKLKMSKNPMIKSLGSIAERYGVKIIAGAAIAAVTGYTAIELLHPEMAFAAEDVNSGDNTLDVDVQNDVKTEEPVVETKVEETVVDNNTVEGTVVSVEDAAPAVSNASEDTTEQTPFAADPSAEKADDFEDYSNIDYHEGKDGKPILDYHYDDKGNVVIDASDEEIAEKMQQFKDENKETEPETTPHTEPDTTPETEPKTTPHTEPGTTPEKPTTPSNTIPQTGDDLLNKTVVLAGMAMGAMTVLKMAKDKMFKADKVASSVMRMGVVSGRPTYENITYGKGLR